jgi:L-ascorbate metabolism protein UlaG (beta-lactamase superfamily)
VTHGHGDHLGDTVALAKKHKSSVVCIYEVYLWLNAKGVETCCPMSKGGSQRVGDIEVTMTQAIHSSGIEDGGQVVYAGEPAGYVVRLPGGLVLYHAGDTGIFGDMKLMGELYAPELACLPIGDLYTMGPREAALAIRLLGVKHVIPMHYGTFPPLTGTPEELRRLTQDVAGLTIHALKPGETLG